MLRHAHRVLCWKKGHTEGIFPREESFYVDSALPPSQLSDQTNLLFSRLSRVFRFSRDGTKGERLHVVFEQRGE